MVSIWSCSQSILYMPLQVPSRNELEGIKRSSFKYKILINLKFQIDQANRTQYNLNTIALTLYTILIHFLNFALYNWISIDSANIFAFYLDKLSQAKALIHNLYFYEATIWCFFLNEHHNYIPLPSYCIYSCI